MRYRKETVSRIRGNNASVEQRDANLTLTEDGQDWFVPREDTNLALSRSGDNLLCRAREHFVVCRDNADREFCHD